MIVVCLGHEWDSWLRRSNRILLGLCEKGLAEHVIFFERPLTFRNIYEYLTGRANHTVNERCRRLLRHGFMSRVNGRITVATAVIPAVFFRSRALQAVNEALRTVQHLLLLRSCRALKKSKDERVLLWLQRPEFNSRYIRRVAHWKVLYDCTEDYIELLKGEAPALWEKYKEDDTAITEKADLITTVSKEYAGIKARSNPNTHWVSNGVDYQAFVKAAGENGGRKERHNGNPVLAFIGILNHRHDLDLVLTLARRYPGAAMELVGPANSYVASKVAEEGIQNIRFIPGIAAGDIPRYLRWVDVCLSPLKHDYLNRTGSSMKIYQYLASGLPIVAYPVSDAEYFGDVIYLAEDRDKYVELVGVAMNEPPDDPRAALRKEYARENDWAVKVEKFRGLVLEIDRGDSVNPGFR